MIYINNKMCENNIYNFIGNSTFYKREVKGMQDVYTSSDGSKVIVLDTNYISKETLLKNWIMRCNNVKYVAFAETNGVITKFNYYSLSADGECFIKSVDSIYSSNFADIVSYEQAKKDFDTFKRDTPKFKTYLKRVNSTLKTNFKTLYDMDLESFMMCRKKMYSDDFVKYEKVPNYIFNENNSDYSDEIGIDCQKIKLCAVEFYKEILNEVEEVINSVDVEYLGIANNILVVRDKQAIDVSNKFIDIC